MQEITTIKIRTDILESFRKKFPKETKPMTDDTLVTWLLTDRLLVY